MNTKRKMHLLLIAYILLSFLSLCGFGYTCYYTINALINNIGVLWVNIVVMSIMIITFVYSLACLIFVKKVNVTFTLFMGMFLVVVLFLINAIQIIFDFVHINNSISIYLENNTPVLVSALTIIMLACANLIATMLHDLRKTNKKEVIEVSEVPTYDEELMLKKRLNEMSRKVEMKKITDKIEAMKKELEE